MEKVQNHLFYLHSCNLFKRKIQLTQVQSKSLKFCHLVCRTLEMFLGSFKGTLKSSNINERQQQKPESRWSTKNWKTLMRQDAPLKQSGASKQPHFSTSTQNPRWSYDRYICAGWWWRLVFSPSVGEDTNTKTVDIATCSLSHVRALFVSHVTLKIWFK